MGGRAKPGHDTANTVGYDAGHKTVNGVNQDAGNTVGHNTVKSVGYDIVNSVGRDTGKRADNEYEERCSSQPYAAGRLP